MLSQECFSGHEDDDDGRRDPEDHPASDQIAQVHEHDCSLLKERKRRLVSKLSCIFRKRVSPINKPKFLHRPNFAS